METCAICEREISYDENIIFVGFSTNRYDRSNHQDTISVHTDCCPQILLQTLEDKLINF